MAQTKKSPKGNAPPLHFTGRAAWTGAEENSEGTITRAVDRGTELAMDISVDGGGRYSVLLRRSGMSLAGQATAVGEADSASCKAEEFVGESGRALVGQWIEDGDRFDWWVKLDPEPLEDE